MSDVAERLSLSELARRLGRAKSGLHKLAASGQIPKGEDGKFDLAEVQAALADNIDPSRQSGTFTRSRERTPAAENGERGEQDRPSLDAGQAGATPQGRIREILHSEGIKLGRKPLTFAHVRQAEKIIQVRQRDQEQGRATGRLVDVEVFERRWGDEMLKLRNRLLAVPSDVAIELPHLSRHDVSEIDRVLRTALTTAAEDAAA